MAKDDSKPVTKKDLFRAFGDFFEQVLAPYFEEHVEKRFDKIEAKLKEHDHHFEKIEEHLDQHDKHFEKIEEHLDQHDRRFDKLDDRLDRHGKMLDDHEKAIADFKRAVLN